MARIRTIKPEFFTSEDVTELSPFARLLFIALWCEADREGRMEWKPKTFKLRYLPADSCDINELCQEILDRGLVVLYGEGLAHIPTFKEHQHINPREAESRLPIPDASITRQSRVSDAQGGREGKGKEPITPKNPSDSFPQGDGDSDEAQRKTSGTPKRGCQLPADFYPDATGVELAESTGVSIAIELPKFSDWHRAKGSVMKDWQSAWRNWARNAVKFSGPAKATCNGRRPNPENFDQRDYGQGGRL